MDTAYKAPQQQHLCIVVTDDAGTVEERRCGRWGRHLTTIGLCLIVLVVLPLHPILPVVDASSPDPASRPNSSSAQQLPAVTASARQLDQLFSSEQLVVGHLRRFVSRADRHLELIESYLDVYDADRVSIGAASNPARDYKLLQRVEEFWNPELYNIDDLLTDLTSARNMMSELGSRPAKSEAVETISALLRIQKIYHLDIVQLARGTMLGLKTGTELSLTDVRKLADIAFSSRAMDMGLVWTEALQELISVTGDATQLTQVNRELLMRRQQHDELLRTSAGQYQLFPEPIGSRSARQLQQEMSDSISDPTRPDPSLDGARYDLLCRGIELRTASVLARLSCDLHVPDLYYILQPIRRETLHRQPFIYSFHNFINDGQIEQLVQVAIANMSRSAVGSYGSTVWSRVSTTARIPHSERIAARMDARIRMVTGLETSDIPGYRQEMLQVAEYGTAGFFGLHFDFLNVTATQSSADTDVTDKRMLDAGERTASFMIYLSDVQRGGRTVFPRLGLSILPERGSAVFWYNKLPDDTLDTGTLHAGCPVAYGHKWIANKFIRDAAQTFTYPCRYRRTMQDTVDIPV